MCVLMALSGCAEQDPKRHYQEIVIEPQSEQPADHRHADDRTALPGPAVPAPPLPASDPQAADTPEFTWDTPSGWTESPGTGMRLATLELSHGYESAECTLIALSGDTGSLSANVRRWMEQVDIEPPPEEEMQAYLSGLRRFETQGGLEGVLVDFSPWIADPSRTSTLVGVIEKGEHTLFVRLTGSQSLLDSQRDQFMQLCKSVK